MFKKTLDQGWNLTVIGSNVYDIPQNPVSAQVPSSVYSTLLEHGLIPDPFYRDNELLATRLLENDFRYDTEFTVSEEELSAATHIFLRFNGIDTLADILLNGAQIGQTDNMHRVFEFDITDLLTAGVPNHLTVCLHSPIRYIESENERCPVGYSSDAMPGFPHLRKAACMFGWDWGPRLPDAGLFRPVELLFLSKARIESLGIRQIHDRENGIVSRVKMNLSANVEFMDTPAQITPLIRATITGPDGRKWTAESKKLCPAHEAVLTESLTETGVRRLQMPIPLSVDIDNPELWWPNGYGKQPLYTVCAELLDESGSIVDTCTVRTGLRTVTVNTDPMPGETFDPHMKDQTPDLDDGTNILLPQGESKRISVSRHDTPLEGRNFAVEVNGLQIFAMGADYIPEDNLLPRVTRERTDLLLTTAQESHYNSIRIWGGGYFPDDFFYELCDEKGLLIWQDMMFTCASYELSPAFIKNTTAEMRQNIRRLRNHPCLALWCGNNELETQYEFNAWPQSRKQFYDYIRLFEAMIPDIVHEEDPDAFYWPSSPSSGGNFENSMAENRGDTHYWGVWHGNEPFTAYRKHHYRFLSEFGFQSFPALPTIRRFTADTDRNIFSRVMEMHQRNAAANGKILNYLSATFLYPKNFDELVYCSQLLQADAIRYGVEHFRRHRGTCMGTIVWQLNDCWPVASWASVDYYGNWKALQYAEKRMFAPILISCEEHGEQDQKPNPNTMPIPVDISADLHVSNETGNPVTGLVRWQLRRPDSSIIKAGEQQITVAPYSGEWLPHLDFNDQDPLEAHLTYEFAVDGASVSCGTSLFCAPKHYHFLDPELTLRQDGSDLVVTARNFARAVSVETEDSVLRLDDNFIDLEQGEHRFHVLPTRDFTKAGEEAAPSSFRVRSLYDTYEK
ncbi:MAG: glycoside hydrolase family 2 protein [Clostridia bacterium]|nr:glycoside hydrolase family 2 protein [Clostridia bacterium]